MPSTQKTGFVHSVPIPSLYKTASKIAKKVREGEDSLKNLIYACRQREVKKVYALVLETFKRNDIIDELLQKSQILVKEPRLDLWLAKVLIWEILWGKQTLKPGCKPVEVILKHEKILRELLKDCKDTIQPVLKHNILKPRYVRVNTLKITTEEAVNNFIDEGWNLIPFSNKSNYNQFQDCLTNLQPDEFIKDIHIPDLLIFPPKTEFHQHEAYKSGYIILQDKASCLPVHLLDPSPGSVVLDTCAAPGMKTTQLAALLQNEGTVYAVEVSSNRAKILGQIVESAGATCVKPILKDVMEVGDNFCPDVEYILVDPSCSGSGITDRVEIIKSDIDTRMQRLKKLCNFQAKLLRHTMKSFPKAKRIVYSTCSLNSEENEDVVRQILETSREFKLVDAKEKLPSWNTKTSDIYPELGNMCIFATPEEDKTNGFFVAVFERLKEGEKNPYLNYELCKLFDKQSRSQNMCDNNQLHKNYSNDKSAEESFKSAESTETASEYKKYRILDVENKCTGLPSEINSPESESTYKKKKKSKVHDSEIKKEVITDFNSQSSHQLDQEDKRRKRKNKNYKLNQESDLADPHSHHSAVIENISEEKKDTEPVIQEYIQSENTLIVNKKKKKNKTLEGDENIELLTHKTEKKKKDKNLGTEGTEINTVLDHKKSKKKKNKHDVSDSGENIDLYSDNQDLLDLSGQKKRTKKQKVKKLDNEKEFTDKDPYRDTKPVTQECIQSEQSSNKKKRKHKTLEEDNNTEVFNRKKEKGRKGDNSSIEDTEINTELDHKKSRKKKTKHNVLDIEETENKDLSENLDPMDVSKQKKRIKKQKIDNEKEITDSLFENSSVENTSVKKERKKNKDKTLDKDCINQSDTRQEDVNNSSYVEETNIPLDGKKRKEIKERKRAKLEENKIEQVLTIETEDKVNSKEKKVKKK